jgi:ABC-type branched-subunit amino acid transport system ATPase component
MRPDAGVMCLAGEVYAPHKPSEAREKGVGMVFQHFSLFEGLTVAENIALGISAKLAKTGLRERIITVSTAYGLKLDPDRRVGTLSVGERQRVEIVRCLLQEPKLLIMDEPTSVLTPQEIEVLFATLRRLVSEGCSILYISHKLEEIRSLCDRATILRGGKVVGSCDPKRETARGLAEMMIGTTLTPPQREPGEIGAVRLKVSGLSLVSEHQFGVDLEGVGLEVKGGEILGIAGVAGNGQDELFAALSGERLTEVTCQGWGDDDPAHKNNVYNNPFWNEIGFFKTNRGNSMRIANFRKGAVKGAERAQYYGDKMSFFFNNPIGLGATIVRAGTQKEKDDGGFTRAAAESEPYEVPKWWSTDLLPKPLRHDSGHSGSHTFITHEFIDSLVKGRKPVVNVYEAAAYTAPGIVAHDSSMKGGERLKIPSFDPA